ncbi:aldehyde dehydrogenase family protein [Roseomonas terrae]|uniref:Aldehyde dehydrogenase n=1 Tax=Neoroseomonas terrae TaxID=424799 RepID=A0ABS5EMB2_9PROT|nr:aldehyde dehydrogenase family protein [Neoroseomonas terrae]MBR0652164.1 aldehyde dehydrogenase family protein [Neoroseomonas terrae]
MTPAAALAALRAAEARDGAPDLTRRRALLARLADEMKRRAEDIAAAADADFGGRSRTETILADAILVADAALHARRRLRGWARPRRAGVPIHFQPARAWIEPVPKGIVGIMGPWNYPFQLTLVPAVDAIAAGNRVVLKPSEHAPRCASLIAEIVDAALGPEMARCVTGDATVAEAFAAQPWDHLVFTGGTATGRAVARAAAENLVPVTLELGGKCPAVVLPGTDLTTAARAIMVAKALNGGQTCVAPDTVLLVGHDRAAFETACRATGVAMPETAIVSDRQAGRLDRLAAGAALTPLAPDGPGRRRAIALAEAADDHPLMWEEVFGPILPVRACSDLPEAIRWIAARPAPLAVYLFGGTAAQEAAIAGATRSGAVVRDRCVEHAGMPGLPFGGIGASGHGRTHGEEGFRALSNLRARVRHGRFSLARLLDPPRSAMAERILRMLMRRHRK